MYYLTYRPQTIGEIDNTVPREIIRKILVNKTLPHAFLFVGQKGTGKTSTARIFAKTVNCLKNKFAGTGESVEPCNKCANCTSIDKTSFPDVVEMDAASNRGINEVKSLIKESSYLPIVGKYRVFIIDEAHMITTDGFNALLKTLEEPPSTVIFILATTNLEKVPKTIVSRCIPVTFGKAKKAEIVHMLKRIAAAEKLQATDETLATIADHSEHSFRDAAKLLEELVMQGKLNHDEARAYLGVRSKDNFLVILGTKPMHDAFAWINEFSLSGGSFSTLISDLLSQLHSSLLAKHKIGADDLSLPFSAQETAFLMKLLTEAYVNMRNAPVDSIPLEIATVEFYNRNTRS